MSRMRFLNLKKTGIRFAIVAMGMTMLFSVTCKKQTVAIQGIVLFQMGQVEVQRANADYVPLQVRDAIKEKDIIRTGANSFATIQFGDKGVVRIQENTVANFRMLFSNDQAEIYLNQGEVLSKIERLQKEERYTIKTPTAVASVRGTEFSAGYADGKSYVAVSTGKVSVGKKSSAEQSTEDGSYSKETAMVETGNTAVVTEEAKTETDKQEVKLEVRAITPVEAAHVEKISVVELVQEPEKKTVEQLEEIKTLALKKEEEINKKLEQLKTEQEVKEKETKINELINKKTKTLTEIKEVFNRIDEITLYNGRVIQGAIISRGTSYKILTTGATVTISEREIKGTRIIR